MLIILLTANTLQNPQIETSRIVVYLNENLVGNVKEDLRSEDFSSVWIENRLPGSKENFSVEYIQGSSLPIFSLKNGRGLWYKV